MGKKNYKAINRLVYKAMQGDRKAFESLCKHEAQSVIYTCIKLMGNRQDGEDAAQEVFIRIQQKLPTLQAPEAFYIWLQKTVVSVCSNMRRDHMKFTNEVPIEEFEELLSSTDDAILPQEYLQKTENKQELMAMIDNLPSQTKTCMLLYYFNDLKIVEIAEVMEVAEGTVKTHLYLGREKIRREIDKKSYPAVIPSEMLLSLSALEQIFSTDVQDIVTGAAVSRCLGAIGIHFIPLTILPYIKGTIVVTVCTAAVAATLVGGTYSASLPGNQSSLSNVTQSHFSVAGFEDSFSAPAEDTSGPYPSGPDENSLPLSSSAAEPEPTDSYSVHPVVPSSKNEPLPTDCSGKILLVENNTGIVIADGSQYLTQLLVLLIHPDGQHGTAPVDSSGNFHFNLREPPLGTYTLKLLIPENSHFVFAGSTLNGVVYWQATGSNSSDILFYVTERVTPVCSVELVSNDCACGHVNPIDINMVVQDSLPTKTVWSLTSNTRQSVASGSHPPTQADLIRWKDTLPDGTYKLHIQVTDLAGNATQLIKHIHIDSNTIGVNQYA